jgi:hypothetical protein
MSFLFNYNRDKRSFKAKYDPDPTLYVLCPLGVATNRFSTFYHMSVCLLICSL